MGSHERRAPSRKPDARSVVARSPDLPIPVRTMTALLAAGSTGEIARSASDVWHSPARALPRAGIALLGGWAVITCGVLAAVNSSFGAEHIEMPRDIVALQSTASFAAGLHGTPVTPAGSVRMVDNGARPSSEGAPRQ